MKTRFRIPALFFLAAMLCMLVVVSCNNDNVTPPADVTALTASITAATAVATAAVEGKNDGQYPVGSKAALQTAITSAQAVAANTASTQTEADNAKVSLDLAVTTFQALVITPIAVESLIAHWSFNEGTGTTAGDESANNFDGTLKAAPAAWGAGLPAWAPDRTGAANKALHFTATGGSVEIPYNTALNPASMSVAVWLKADVIDANNRFLGLQSWIGYKFQLQEANRPFLTIGYTGGAYDRDSEQNLPINEWHHVVATFGGGKTLFYVDGVLIKTWENTPEPAKSISAKPYNLVIGQDFPTDKYSAGDGANFDNAASPDYQVIPLAWGGHFKGSLDEMRLYKTVLTGTQVSGLYDREKP